MDCSLVNLSRFSRFVYLTSQIFEFILSFEKIYSNKNQIIDSQAKIIEIIFFYNLFENDFNIFYKKKIF